MNEEETIDTCRNGHPWVPENTVWESAGEGKPRRRRCRACLREKDRRRRRGRELDELAGLGRVGRALRRLPPEEDPPHVLESRQSFDQAMEEIPERNCFNRWDEWANYDDDAVPDAKRAREMCAGCPLLAACAQYAEDTEQGWGVWGGEVWVYGKRV